MYVHTQCRYTAVTAIEQFKYFYSFIIAELSRIFLFTPDLNRDKSAAYKTSCNLDFHIGGSLRKKCKKKL